MAKYVFADDMREVSGLGGAGEETCRKMIISALEWLDNNPGANPQFNTNPGIFGSVAQKNDDAKRLEAIISPMAAQEGLPGSAVSIVIGHIMFVHKQGWDKYKEEMKRK